MFDFGIDGIQVELTRQMVLSVSAEASVLENLWQGIYSESGNSYGIYAAVKMGGWDGLVQALEHSENFDRDNLS